MPSYQFPSTASGINVDDHLNDFLVENDLQGLHSHVWPARQGSYTIEDDMDYFRGKWGFYFNAYVTGSDTDGSRILFPTGAVRFTGPAFPTSFAQQYEGGISGSKKVFMYEPYPSASFVATGSAGFVLQRWATGKKWNAAVGYTSNAPTYSTDYTINVPYSSSINTFYAVFERDCTLDVIGKDCDLKFEARYVSQYTPTPTSTATPTATDTYTPTSTATPTATDTYTPTATATDTSTPTPTATITPTATATDTPTATPTATDTPTATPTDTPTATPTATPTETITCNYYTFMANQGFSATAQWTDCDGIPHTQFMNIGDTLTVCALSSPAPSGLPVYSGGPCVATATPTYTPGPTATPTPTDTYTPGATSTPTSTATTTPTATNSAAGTCYRTQITEFNRNTYVADGIYVRWNDPYTGYQQQLLSDLAGYQFEAGGDYVYRLCSTTVPRYAQNTGGGINEVILPENWEDQMSQCYYETDCALALTTPTPTATPTATATPTITETPGVTYTPTATETSTSTSTGTPTYTPVPTNTPTATPTYVPGNCYHVEWTPAEYFLIPGDLEVGWTDPVTDTFAKSAVSNFPITYNGTSDTYIMNVCSKVAPSWWQGLNQVAYDPTFVSDGGTCIYSSECTYVGAVPTPTPTATSTYTPGLTPTPTITDTPTATPTATDTPTPTPTYTPTTTATPTTTFTLTPTPGVTYTPPAPSSSWYPITLYYGVTGDNQAACCGTDLVGSFYINDPSFTAATAISSTSDGSGGVTDGTYGEGPGGYARGVSNNGFYGSNYGCWHEACP